MEEREFSFSDNQFKYIASLMYSHMGIHLSEQKKDMVYARLSRRLRKMGLDSFDQYFGILENGDEKELENLVNAITTNVTGFFREPHHFTHLAQTAIPEIVKRNAADKKIRMWSAGCSLGMEAYTIAVTFCHHFPELKNWDVKILATDIDTTVLEKGKRAEYDDRQLEKIPLEYKKYFTHDAAKETILVNDEAKRLVSFGRLNLHEPWPMKGQFDIIFCRNVVIYFDKPTQKVLFDRYADILKDGCWIYIGHSESLFQVSDRFQLVGNTVYQKI